jgi:hypothetical protein
MTEYIHCIEIWPENAEIARNRKWFNSIEVADITEWQDPDDYDIAVWWHGPEHVEQEKAIETIIRMRTLVPIVWLAMPWGLTRHGDVYGNPYQSHLSRWEPETLIECGYEVAGYGKRDKRDSYLLAWYPPGQSDET